MRIRDGQGRPGRRRGRLIVQRAGWAVLGVLVVCALWPSSWLPHDAFQTDSAARFISPRLSGYVFGTDALGRDIFSMMVVGTRYTLMVVFGAALIGLVIGVSIGLAAGYSRGWVEAILMRLTDIQLAFPQLILLIAVIAAFGPKLSNLIAILGVASAAPYARLAHGAALTLRERPYIDAARVCGARTVRILGRHLLPNSWPTILVYFTYDLAQLVLLESSLSYLGFGIQPPTPSWGTIVAEAQEYMTVAPWASLVPGVAIVVTVAAFNFVGDGLRERAGLGSDDFDGTRDLSPEPKGAISR